MGRPRKNPLAEKAVADIPKPIENPTIDDLRAGTPVDVGDGDDISVDRVIIPTLANPKFDPFRKFKTDEKKFYYRALNTKNINMTRKEAQGYQTIPGSEYGDLVLAKLPREIHNGRTKLKDEKTKRMSRAAKDQFREEMERLSVDTKGAVGYIKTED